MNKISNAVFFAPAIEVSSFAKRAFTTIFFAADDQHSEANYYGKRVDEILLICRLWRPSERFTSPFFHFQLIRKLWLKYQSLFFESPAILIRGYLRH